MAKRVQNTKKNLASPISQETMPFFEKKSFLWLAIPAFFMLFASTSNVMDTTLITKYLAFAFVLLGFTVWFWTSQKGDELSKIFKENAFFWVYLAFIFFSGISLFDSKIFGDGFISWSKMPLAMIFTCFCVAYFDEKENFRENSSFVVGIFTLISSAVACYQSLNIFQETEITHMSTYQINSLFSHRNIFGEIIVLCLPFNVFGVLHAKDKVKKWVAILATFFCLAFSFGLFSRSIWLSIFFASSFTFVFYGWHERTANKKKLLKYAGLCLIFLIFVFIGLGLITSFSEIYKSLYSIINFQDYTNQERIIQWKNSLILFSEKPFFGIGMENWRIETLQFPIPKGIKGDKGDYFFQRPHNDYLWILSESGIFAFTFFLSIFGVAYYYIYKTLKSTDNQEVKNWLYLLFGGLTAYLIFSNFSFPKERMEDIFLLHLIFVGILVEKNKVSLIAAKNTPASFLPSKIILSAVILFLVVCFYIGYQRFDGEFHLRKYYRLSEEANKQQGERKKYMMQNAIQEIYLAYRPLYKMNPISTPLKYFSGTKYLELNELDLGIRDLKEALELSPNHPQVLNNLGAAYSFKNDRQQALKYIDKVITLTPQYEDPLLSGVALQILAHNYDKSFEYLTKIDSNSKNPKYLYFKQAVRDSIGLGIAQKLDEPFLKDKVVEIMHKKEWTDAILFKAKKQNIPFSLAIKEEALEMMKKDKNLSEAEWVMLRGKYLSKSQ